MATSKKWLAVYTKPRWEKKVFQFLSDREIEAYCPMNKVRRQWTDRVKVVEEPLFKSYVFVRVENENQQDVRMVNGVVNFVYWLGKPAIINDKEIVTIKRFLNEYDEVIVEQSEISPNQEVVVTGGAMMDRKGTVLKIKGKRIQVKLDFLDYTLVAHIDKQHLRTVPTLIK